MVDAGNTDTLAEVPLNFAVGGEVAVEGKITRNVLLDHSIDELDTQRRVALEHGFLGQAGLLLAKTTELQRIMLAGGAHIVDNQIVVGNQVALVGVIPEPSDIGN